MRRISRPPQVPTFLLSPEVREAKTRLYEFLRRPLAERSQRRAPLNEDLFHHPELGHVLEQVFEGKCAYCEMPLRGTPIAHHFRPLQFAEPLQGPNAQDYYAWLAFEWRNIIASCDGCEKAKNVRFPMERGSRANYLARYDDIREQEYPQLIDPCAEDPRKFLYFLSDGSCLHKQERGAATIVILDLNRPELLSSRSETIGSWARMLAEVEGHQEFASALVNHGDRLFDPGSPHLAASLDVLRRILIAWRGSSARDVSYMPQFLRNVAEEIRSIDTEEHHRLARVTIETLQGDRERGPDLRETVLRDMPRSELLAEAEAILPMPSAADREILSITISHLKAIDELRIEMPSSRSQSAGVPCLAILGENSTGKSTILSAVALALIGQRQARRVKLTPSHLLSSTDNNRFDQLEARPPNVTVDYYASTEQASFHLDPVSERITGQDRPTSVILGYGPRRYFSPRYRIRSEGARYRVKTLFDPLATIPYPNDWLARLDGAQFDTVARALRIVLALNDEDQLVNDPEEGMSVEANGRRTPVERLSEGYKSMFAMVVDIIHELLDYYPNLELAQAVVLVDEIETHLHPRWKMQIMTSLRKALPRVQFIVTTHDPLCLRGMDDNEVLVLQRVEGAKIRPLQNLPSVKGMSAEELLTSDYFGLSSTTDPRVELDLARLKGDQVVRDENGETVVTLSPQTEDMLKSLSLGNSAAEMVMQDALKTYLSEREVERGKLRSDVREEAVQAILSALSAPIPG